MKESLKGSLYCGHIEGMITDYNCMGIDKWCFLKLILVKDIFSEGMSKGFTVL